VSSVLLIALENVPSLMGARGGGDENGGKAKAPFGSVYL
jgi:hypothetical protein